MDKKMDKERERVKKILELYAEGKVPVDTSKEAMWASIREIGNLLVTAKLEDEIKRKKKSK
jgi:predicted Rossmann fold nucleotide-binding protein DprA/Smf involved in DNA uptake